MWNVREWITEAGLSVTEVARRAGVSRTTIMRIQNGTVSPSVSTLTELAIACGRHLEVTTRPLSDPNAAQAARYLLESGFVPDDQTAAEAWASRLERMRLSNPVDIVQAAGCASAPGLRPETRLFAGQHAVLAASSAGEASGQRWAISGAPVLGSAGGTAVLHCENAQRCAGLLQDSMRERAAGQSADLVVVPAGAGTFYDSWEQDHVRLAAPIQGLLDCVGLGGELAEAALAEARRW